VNPGYGESLSNAKKKNQPEDQGRESDQPTFNGVEIYGYNSEGQTLNKGEEDEKNNGQAPVPIPNGPCA